VSTTAFNKSNDDLVRDTYGNSLRQARGGGTSRFHSSGSSRARVTRYCVTRRRTCISRLRKKYGNELSRKKKDKEKKKKKKKHPHTPRKSHRRVARAAEPLEQGLKHGAAAPPATEIAIVEPRTALARGAPELGPGHREQHGNDPVHNSAADPRGAAGQAVLQLLLLVVVMLAAVLVLVLVVWRRLAIAQLPAIEAMLCRLLLGVQLLLPLPLLLEARSREVHGQRVHRELRTARPGNPRGADEKARVGCHAAREQPPQRPLDGAHRSARVGGQRMQRERQAQQVLEQPMLAGGGGRGRIGGMYARLHAHPIRM
jgi:hypothetical protein